MPTKIKKTYDTMIMSWSCFGDFILISQTMKTLIAHGIIKKGIIITHQKELIDILPANENIELLFPRDNIRDFFKVLFLSFSKNIFVLHDMPSHNRFSKEIRFIFATLLTFLRQGSRFILLADVQFKETFTTRLSKLVSNSWVTFDKTTRTHISQYMLDLLHEANVIGTIECQYDITISGKELDISQYGEYIVMNPFASSDGRNMSLEWYIEFITEFEKISSKKIILLGSKKDVLRADTILQNTKNVVSMCGKTIFRNTIYLLQNSYGMINVDSGPTHYGAFCRKKQIILWGESQYFSYMPIHNPNAIFIFGDKALPAQDVYAADIEFKKYADINTVLKACKDLHF